MTDPVEDQYKLITRNLEEVISEEEIKEILRKDGKLKIYWGTATTGKPHLGYFVPIFKLADYLKAGCEVTVLLADLHGLLDNMKSSFELLQARTRYYEFIIRAMLNVVGVNQSNLRFVKGTDYQLSPEYTLDMYKMTTHLTTVHTERAGAEVVKQVENPLISSLLYPILQALDEQYLGVNCQFGGVDQRKIFMFARQWLPKLNYQPRVYLMNPIVPGLGKPGEDGRPAKMSSSDPNSKIDFDDSLKTIKGKFQKAYSVDGVVECNGLLAILKYVVFRFLEVQNRPLVINRPAKWGGDVVYNTYEEVVADFASGKLASADLKSTLSKEINEIISPLREVLASTEGKALIEQAYPTVVQVVTRQTADEATFSCLDVRVGKILHAEKHPGADSLFVEKIDVGEPEPRTILSGLVGYYTAEQLTNRKVLVICNLPPKTMKGITSQGMVFAASMKDGDNKTVHLLEPDDESNPGDKVFVEGCEGEVDPEVKNKRWGRVSKFLVTNEQGLAVYKNTPFRTNSGLIKPTPIVNGIVG